MNWDDLRILHAVARHGSLSAAARALATTQPTVSRRLDAFERRIGVRLFERCPTGLAPTPLCAALIDSVDRMEDAALAVERRLAARDTGLEGRIAVTSLDWLGDYVIAPIAARFGARHPLVEIEVVSDQRVYNLSRRDADIAFRFGAFEQENLISRTVAEVSYGLYAAPAYLAEFGRPDFADGCAGHGIIALHRSAGTPLQSAWLADLAPAARIVLRASGIRAHVAAAELGLAMAVLPRVVGDFRPGLERLPPPAPEPSQPVRLGVHADMREAPRVRAFIDFAVAELKSRAADLRPV